MISKRAAVFGAIILILCTAFFSSFITLRVNEYMMISNGDVIQAQEYTELKDSTENSMNSRALFRRIIWRSRSWIPC